MRASSLFLLAITSHLAYFLSTGLETDTGDDFTAAQLLEEFSTEAFELDSSNALSQVYYSSPEPTAVPTAALKDCSGEPHWKKKRKYQTGDIVIFKDVYYEKVSEHGIYPVEV